MEVEHGIEEHENAGGTRAEDGVPPPAVVFAAQLEVCQCHRDTCGDSKKNDIDQHQNAVESVVFTSPDGGEDVVQFDGDGTEGKEAANHHVGEERTVDWNRWNLTPNRFSSAGSIERDGSVLAKDAAEDGERKPNTEPDEDDQDDGCHRQGLR